METRETSLPGVVLIKNFVSHDPRGTFVKTFNQEAFARLGLSTEFVESYYSVSHQNVVRGMHFQLPPHDHDKLVYVTQGSILDVVVDLRPESATFRQHVAIELVEETNSLYIPRGCAHGFLTLTPMATVLYNVTSVYAPTADAGVRWDSIGLEWPVQEAIVSARDAAFPSMAAFTSVL